MRKRTKSVLQRLQSCPLFARQIDDRIEAFITRKRKEVDEWNVQEFCSSSKAAEADGEPGRC